MAVLTQVASPTLLIVGGNDPEVIALNRQAYNRLIAVKRLEVIPGATHLFTERGALEKVADLAAEWFAQHMPRPEDRPAVAHELPPCESANGKPREIWLD
jgi:hypothetical protein